MKRRYPKIDKSEHSRIVELYKKLDSAVPIAKEYGVHPSTIMSILRQYNVEVRRNTSKKYDKFDDALICHQYVDLKMSLLEIATPLGVHYLTIRRILKNNGISCRDKKARDQIRTAYRKIPLTEHPKIVELYQIDKKTSGQIAKMYQVDPETILRILKKNGVKIRKQGTRC